MDPYTYARLLLSQAPRDLAWHEQVPPTWQESVRTELCRHLGIAPQAPDMDRIEEGPAEIYTPPSGPELLRQPLTIFHSGLTIPAWRLRLPDQPARAAAIYLHGHGPGVLPAVGFGEPGYHRHMPIRMAQAGLDVLAPEMLSFGARCSERDRANGYSCQHEAMLAIAAGETLLGWRVQDARVAGEALRRVSGIEKVGIVGISGGGTCALFTAAVDVGFSAVGISGYFCRWEHSIFSLDHCVDNYVPGLAARLGCEDLAGLIFPRSLFLESGELDPIFPLEGYREAVEFAKRIYRTHLDRLRPAEFADEHVFHGEAMLESLQEWAAD